jgi:hypothetical protein
VRAVEACVWAWRRAVRGWIGGGGRGVLMMDWRGVEAPVVRRGFGKLCELGGSCW